MCTTLVELVVSHLGLAAESKGGVVGPESSVVGAESSVVGAESSVVGAESSVVGAESSVVGAESSVVGAESFTCCLGCASGLGARTFTLLGLYKQCI